MAKKVIVAHHPELTAEDAMKVVESHFAGKYEISGKYGLFKSGFYFVVKKSAWSGATVQLMQRRKQTAFVISGEAPSLAVMMLFLVPFLLFPIVVFVGGAGEFIGFMLLLCLWWYAFFRPSKKIVNETKTLIENAEEFK
jgi:hypothetical protein